MNVAAIIVTRGDQDLTPVIASLPDEWQVFIWDNGERQLESWGEPDSRSGYGRRSIGMLDVSDLSVYGRYAAIEYTTAELIYVQDDDCVVSDPQAIVQAWLDRVEHDRETRIVEPEWLVVCNMPPEFRYEFYEEHALVGFGAAFHRDAPSRAFSRFGEMWPLIGEEDFFDRTCDIVFTGLTPRVLVDVPKEDLPYAHYEDRLWKQPGHLADRVRMLDLVRQIR